MDCLMAGERAANRGWKRPLEFEGFQSDANSVWIASRQASVLQIVVGMEPSNLRGPRVSGIECGSPEERQREVSSATGAGNITRARRDTEKKQSRVLARARLAEQHNQIGGAAQRPQGVTGQPRTPK